jgi:transcription termination factor NusB
MQNDKMDSSKRRLLQGDGQTKGKAVIHFMLNTSQIEKMFEGVVTHSVIGNKIFEMVSKTIRSMTNGEKYMDPTMMIYTQELSQRNVAHYHFGFYLNECTVPQIKSRLNARRAPSDSIKSLNHLLGYNLKKVNNNDKDLSFKIKISDMDKSLLEYFLKQSTNIYYKESKLSGNAFGYKPERIDLDFYRSNFFVDVFYAGVNVINSDEDYNTAINLEELKRTISVDIPAKLNNNNKVSFIINCFMQAIESKIVQPWQTFLYLGTMSFKHQVKDTDYTNYVSLCAARGLFTQQNDTTKLIEKHMKFETMDTVNLTTRKVLQAFKAIVEYHFNPTKGALRLITEWIHTQFLVKPLQRQNIQCKALLIEAPSDAGKTSFVKTFFDEYLFGTRQIDFDTKENADKGIFNSNCLLWLFPDMNTGLDKKENFEFIQNLVDNSITPNTKYKAKDECNMRARPLIICTTKPVREILAKLEENDPTLNKELVKQFSKRMIHFYEGKNKDSLSEISCLWRESNVSKELFSKIFWKSIMKYKDSYSVEERIVTNPYDDILAKLKIDPANISQLESPQSDKFQNEQPTLHEIEPENMNGTELDIEPLVTPTETIHESDEEDVELKSVINLDMDEEELN